MAFSSFTIRLVCSVCGGQVLMCQPNGNDKVSEQVFSVVPCRACTGEITALKESLKKLLAGKL